MRIVNLIEDTKGASGCAFAHGLSFYVETEKHRLLVDLGPSGETLQNAERLGVDLRAVDTVVLSHGHYDHSGGILPFTEINDHADIYMQSTAGGEYYADDGADAPNGRYRYIGIDPRILKLPQVKLLHGDHTIDEELELITIDQRTHALPSVNRNLLVRRDGGYVRDDFAHEHFLVVKENGRKVLLSGCAHNGILSILDAYAEKCGGAPDAVVSGFHLMKKTPYDDEELAEIAEIARKLREYPTRFYSCHCTGLTAFEIMKEICGEQLTYVHSGEDLALDDPAAAEQWER